MTRISLDLDVSADAAYISFSDANVSKTKNVSDLINYDYDALGQLCGVEVLAIAALGQVDWDGVADAINPELKLPLFELLRSYGLCNDQVQGDMVSTHSIPRAFEVPRKLITA